jgi:hypothetical protein
MESDMTKITIELPDHVEISSGDYKAAFEWAKIDGDKLADFVAKAACIGVAKAGNDSASGAKQAADKAAKDGDELTVDEARAMLIDKWIAARYESGEFGAIRGAGLTDVDAELIVMYRPIVRAKDEKRYKNADDSTALVVEYIAGLKEAERDAATATAKKRLEVKAAQKAALAALEIPGVAVS